MNKLRVFALFSILLHSLTVSVFAEEQTQCSQVQIWDASMSMCMPLPMGGPTGRTDMTMLMLSGNAFATGITESGPRGRNAFAAPNIFMLDFGTTIGASQYLNLDYMGTLERWTFPYSGYPELLQMGEANSQGEPFLDSQHPHSSPVMGLTLSDTFRFSENSTNSLKLFFSPRGESTDGPVAFMHRITGMINPDVPLGHHIGQDVGHISSTVVGASLKLNSTSIEVSTFNGTEPDPDSIDLPFGALNSYAFRVIEAFSPHLTAMASVAQVNHSEPNASRIYRYSGSIYSQLNLGGEWDFYNTFIYGLISNYDGASTVSSVDDEFLFKKDMHSLWGRFEVLQRTPAELMIAGNSDPNDGRWVEALTLGYTHRLAHWSDCELGLGGSVTLDRLPSIYSQSYGSSTPRSGKIFLQLSGSKIWNL